MSDFMYFKYSVEAQDRLYKFLEGRAKSLSDEHIAKQERYDQRVEKLNWQIVDLQVRSSLLLLSISFLIFQQILVMKEITKRMKLEGKYNVQGVLGM